MPLIPGFAGEVERSVAITVKAQNRHGQPVRVKAKGWLASIFQHELDHLEGVLFIDRAENVWELRKTTRFLSIKHRPRLAPDVPYPSLAYNFRNFARLDVELPRGHCYL